jgi:16S rRNA (guanine527-N7)-methyltransferase
VTDKCAAALPSLVEGAGSLGLGLDAKIQQAFAAYCDLLIRANARMNLTALRTPEAMMTGLFLDSLTCVLALPDGLLRGDRPVHVVDVGSGAGLPGVPLRLLFPHWRLTLIESIGKKARFLEELVAALSLEGTQVLARRAEEVSSDPALRERGDLCLARAVAPLPSLVELCAPLVRTGGLMLFPKGRNARAEVAEASLASAQAAARWDCTVPLPPDLAHLGEGRALVLYRKTGATPAQFPRRVGLAQSQPLRPRRLERRPTRENRPRPQ